ncbi:MAG TPA: hypothetical protein VME66_04760, partial [Candidatus Acidoferrales bacterium]|nr:hypothetical protein [Candidatus Acidoferrales bacterium]
NLPGTLCEGAADLKRLAKDTDSAWLRYALDAAKLPANEAPENVLARTVIACHDVGALRTGSERDEVIGLAAHLREFRGFLVVDRVTEDATPADLESAIRTLRACVAEAALEEAARDADRTGRLRAG